ncbi:sugar porter family MFS transporter [Parabacteroides bouchesdurhonensis]|uniref:sugar porter family MFS transporter n=1 Tax=Parabacteroides bouchesdurhonensis TaxID=1936995 RepID=UPI000C866907|nr:sugar porter family MFS transporter [Parabacteroides bouchesdurhonensis]
MKNNNINMGYVIFLSLVAALGGFLFGYDTAVVSGTNQQVAKLFNLDEMQLGWYVGCALIGSIGGVSVAGILGDKFGRKRTMLFSAILFSLSAIGCAVSSDFTMLVVSRIFVGVGIGIVSIISPLYISEVAVSKYRGSLVSLYQFGVTVGMVGAYLVNHVLLNVAESGLASLADPSTPTLFEKVFYTESWRAMLGMCAVPSILFFIVIFFIPESPRWLILQHRNDTAQSILERIYGSIQEAMAQLESTRQMVLSESSTKTGQWAYLFKPAIFKMVLIGSAIAILGQFMGVNAVLYYGPTIFEQSGLSGGDSLFYQVLVGAVNMVTTIIALFIIDKVGRKQLVYWGVSGMIIALLMIAFYFHYGEAMGISSVFLLISFMFYIFCCAISICAVVFVLLSEMFPIRVRGLAMSIAGFSLWIGTYLIGQLTPWMLKHFTPEGTFLLFAVMCIPYMFIMWKLVPETTGRSLEEIEQMISEK